MAEVTERFADIHEGWLTVDITYDDVTLRVQTITITPNVPAGHQVHAALYRGASNGPAWREATFTENSPVWSQSRPFGGGFNNLDQIKGAKYGWEIL